MIIETYSLRELADLGWKYSEPGNYFYIGSSRYPTQRIGGCLIDLMGKKFELHSIDKGKTRVDASIVGEDEDYYIPDHLIKTKLPNLKVKKMIFRDEVVTYNGINFVFPCEMKRMSNNEAIEVAKWILKVAKAGKK